MAKAPRRDDLRDRPASSTARRRAFATERSSRSRSRARSSRSRRGRSGPRSGSRSREGVRAALPARRARRASSPLLDDARAPRSRAARGRLVEITGEPGIGKTRLLEELRERAPGPDARCTRRARPTRPRRRTPPGASSCGRSSASGLGGSRRRRARAPAGGRRRRATPSCCPGCRCSRSRFDVDMPPTRRGRRARARLPARASCTRWSLRFLRDRLREPTLIEIEDAHLMDAASADLLGRHRRAASAASRGSSSSPAATRARASGRGPGRGRGRTSSPARWTRAEAWPSPRRSPRTTRCRRTSCGSPPSARAGTRSSCATSCAPSPRIATRRCRTRIEAAAMARIDRLDAADRALVRRAAVLGLSFHPRFLADVLEGLVEPPDERDLGAAVRALRRRRRRLPALPAGGRPRRRLRRACRSAVRRRLHARRGRAPGGRRRAGAPTSWRRSSRCTSRAPGDHAQGLALRARWPAHSAHERLAYADAAQLYRHALDAGRAVDAPPEQLAPGPRGARRRPGAHGRARPGARGAARRAPAGRGRPAPRGRPPPPPRPARPSGPGTSRSAVRWTLGACGRWRRSTATRRRACRARLLSLLATLRQRQGAHGARPSRCAGRPSPRRSGRARTPRSRTPASSSTGRCSTRAGRRRRRTPRARWRSTSGWATSTARRPC